MALRAVFGILLVTHGLPKLTGTGHGSMADPMAGSIHLIENVLHLPMAPLWAMGVAWLEGLGGLMLALGLATRPIALLVTLQMVGICFVLGPTWAWIDRGIEFPFLMAFLALFIALRGGGPLALDSWLHARLARRR
ncbi:DoxX family protein [Coralloluteibacterium thermophilus]|uniref:DoxX family protein n=1 Tax=Coralloluteibacterium thermophilum TaxID=2707049 RepID=A0ABV9NLK0_9GAMM